MKPAAKWALLALGLLMSGATLAQFDVSLLVHRYEGGAQERALTCWHGWWAYGEVGVGHTLMIECYDVVDGLFKDGFESAPSPAGVPALRTSDVSQPKVVRLSSLWHDGRGVNALIADP